ncbi:ABC transporter permease [Natronobacterium gregoryi]|uniref:ABC transporter permease n=2 Tax=Natronobacterium gregoryi TaxID=44930 RepID=L0ALR5_NATGS|nr:ABC transporter permease [Natronobacterium gregoryi]AFZ74838.1 ABC-type dipeptide/oligopeptide/nickel transport system, permease component [Natronobacterium gregoryi SP2]ELY64585.1 binding-protein-dependent transport system inner membrane protein [Natronobacterium gregoryi SP2]PLK18126.1 ABC transporter permease [Natronobacterium gregoryi SP2]SFJ66341.1 peptide/nickel transport system permease protein [Natronobacterium gregoryi]
MSLAKFLTRRILQGVFVLWGVVTILFGLRAISPGDPVTLMLEEGATQDLIEHVREQEGLDEPIYVQYLDYLQGLFVGDFGYSWQSSREVETMVIERIPATVELAVAATIVAIVIAIPLGVISATRRNQPSDYGATLFSLLGISTPNFWLGLMLILVLGVWVGLFPTGRRAVSFHEAVYALVATGSISELGLWLRYITLPALTLGTYFTALITRLTRSGMIDELGKPYVTATRAKGLPDVLVRYKHVLRNTMIPIITVLGLQMGTLMGGAVITETVFNWPGLGLRLVDALHARDWPLMQGIILFIAAAFVVINIVVDGLYASLNPRVREE